MMLRLSTSRKDSRKPTRLVSTGIQGLDDILGGGLTAERVYLIEGSPGTGKTTVGLHFLLDGVAKGEAGLYITMSENADELDAVAESHGWSLEGLPILELADDEAFDGDAQQSILHPAEIELGESVENIMAQVDMVRPARIVFDSLSEMRLLAQNPLRYRRQMLTLKQFFTSRECTVLMLDDKSDSSDQRLHSIAHGVVNLERMVQDFGKERRRLSVVKMRGVEFRGGFHDYLLATGGIRVFPRLVAAEHATDFKPVAHSTGAGCLDGLLGGGLVAGTSTLFVGPSGVGKSTLVTRCMLAALERGERAAYYLFDEALGSFLARAEALGMDLRPHLNSGLLSARPIDPAELSPGQFAQMLQDAVEIDGASFVAIDSLNAYLQAMPGEQFLLLQMHELLAYLNQQGVTTALVLGEHGVVGQVTRDIDLSYLSDSTVLLRYFEAGGKLRRAITVYKSRTVSHALTIHEFSLGANGVEVGESLEGFDGVLTGLPTYTGPTRMITPSDAND
jgi:circadian clock protein KaiC